MRETFSIWPAVGVVAAITFGVAVSRTMCLRGPSKRDLAERSVVRAAEEHVAEWRASHRGCPRVADDVLDDPVDPWSRPYRVICAAERIVITSAGEDGRFGTEDDITAEEPR